MARASVARILVPAAVSIAIIGGLLAVTRSPTETMSVDEVRRSVTAVACANGGGKLGPWHIAAERVHDGVLIGFRVEDATFMLSAERARLAIDPATDTIAFELEGIVFTDLPERAQPMPGADTDDDGTVRSLDRYRLGPVPFHVDIVNDE